MVNRRLAAAVICGLAAGAAASDETLVITAGTQTGFFQTGTDIGSMNPHDYRPNEFVTNDFIFEGLVAWDGNHTEGADGVSGTDDDFVKPSLALSWSTNYAAVVASPSTAYEITFSLRTGVTFHDGSAWDAAAAKANFDQIMGAWRASERQTTATPSWRPLTIRACAWRELALQAAPARPAPRRLCAGCTTGSASRSRSTAGRL